MSSNNNNQFPHRFKRGGKRPNSSAEDAPEAKRSKPDLKNSASGVMTLQYKSKDCIGNYHLWVKEMKKYLATKYGNLARFTTTKPPAYWVPDIIEQPSDESLAPQNDPHGFTMKCFEDMCKLRNRTIQDMDKNKFPMFNEIMDHLSVESVAQIESELTFTVAQNCSDVLALWNLIATTHQTGTAGGSVDERAIDALKAYYLLEQGPKQDLDSYKKATDACLSNLAAIDPASVPSNKRQSISFFKNLDSGRYGNIQSLAQQLSLLGEENAYMDTLTESYSAALNTKVINTKGQFVGAESQYGICAAVSVQQQNRGGRGAGGRGGGGSRGGGREGRGRGRGGKATTSGPTPAEVNAANVIIAAAAAAKKEFVPNCKLCNQSGHWLQDCTLLEKAKKAIGTVAAVNVGHLEEDQQCL